MTAYPEADFSSSRTFFEQTVTDLSDASSASLDHGELERLVRARGTELMRLLTQDHLDLRAHREAQTREPMRGSDGKARTERRPSGRLLGTLFGDVGVSRLSLVKCGVAGGLRPLRLR